MSRIRANQITNQAADGAPTVQHGLIIAGVSTFTGSVSIGGTLTYEDVTNIDSVGLITARNGIDCNGDLDVDGHTNLDNVSISGISSTGNIYITTGGDGRKLSFAGDGSSHYIKMDHTLNGPIINGYGGIAFETNGTNERLRIRSGGEVAIGGAGYAGQPFSVQTSSTNLGYMQSTGTTRAVMNFVDANSTQNVGFGCVGNNHVFTKDGSERLRITSDGVVSWQSGSTPLSGTSNNYTLSIYRDSGGGYGYFDTITNGSNHTGIRIRAYHNGTYNNVFEHTTGDFTRFYTGGSERLRIPSTGGIELKTDGKGIQFPTPQTPTNANTNRTGISSEMRYYETGTVTPGLSSTVLNGLQIATFTDGSYARRVNRYVRVGHIVHCFIEIKMAGSVTYNAGSTSTAPVCIVGTCPFKWAYSGRYDVSGEPDFIPCSISYDSSGLSNDSVYAMLTRNYAAQPRIDITRVGSGGSRQYNSVNFGMVFPANASIAVAYSYPIDLDNADY